MRDNLGYPIYQFLARHVFKWASIGDDDEVRTGLNFLEAALADGGAYVSELVYECLDTLVSCDEVSEIKPSFGPRLMDLWKVTAKNHRIWLAVGNRFTKDARRVGLAALLACPGVASPL